MDFLVAGGTTGALAVLTHCCSSILRSDTPIADRALPVAFAVTIPYGASRITSAL